MSEIPETAFGSPNVEPLRLPDLLRPTIEAAIDESDRRADISEELYGALRDAGAFRLLTPRVLGGSQTPLTTVLKVYEEFGRIDASVAWLVWNANFGFVGALLDESATGQIWGQEREPAFANSGIPGMAVPDDGGYRVSGHWKIVSGINTAEWLVAVVVVMQDGMPRLTAGGSPDVQMCVLHRNQWSVKETWDVSGMRGTGSNDVVAEDVFVPAEFLSPLDAPRRIDEPLYRGFLPALVLPGCTAIVLGVALAALDETVALALAKKNPTTGATLADSPRTQYAIAASEAALQAARLLLVSAAQALEDAAKCGGAPTLEQRAALRAAMTHAAQVSREVLVTLYELASSTPLYRGNRLERLFRDGMAALQHANHSAPLMEAAGRVRLGMDPGVGLF
ncbi:acyl-CoA dehydrogenase family protein (plasmid) [Streptomyces sp. HUAS TT11]|uniref:acyl-CoA dehydrogenase family protein n=1 Tax=Streptomyces sp. HUAS TT11 TaxID=3447508 RepID=UPI003F65E1F3